MAESVDGLLRRWWQEDWQEDFLDELDAALDELIGRPANG
jgi:hypothetical protein